VPVAPLKINNFFILDSETGRASVSINLSSENIDGQPLNASNLYFQILLPGFKNFEVYTFDPELYSEITEPLTDIPYNMTLGLVSGYGVQRNTYIYMPDYDNVGARMVYKDETGVYYSDPIFYYPVDFDAVESLAEGDEPVATQWYNLQGIRIEEPQQTGLYICNDVFADGTIRSKKIFVVK
jgi:hypothetical protein